MKKTLLLFIIAGFHPLFSQNLTRHIQTQLENSELIISEALPKQQIWASDFTVFNLDFAQLDLELKGNDIPHVTDFNSSNTVTMYMPGPDGQLGLFKVFRNTTVHPDLQAVYPELRTYNVVGVSDRSVHGKIDITSHGFHAMIFDKNQGTYFIDPVQQENNSLYMLYLKSDFVSSKIMTCEHNEEQALSISDIVTNDEDILLSYASCQLRTYRLALAATGEYTIFHGGTVALALAAQVTTMNRVNGIYEREMAITMEIIPNNNLIIYTNAGSDPYSNGDAFAMLGENQTTCGTVIGSANYDIGHVFGTNSGGVAGLGVVCNSTNNNKARGVTGSGTPIGDPFDVDYVAHEIGHQFAANHTQNNGCNRNNATAMEPGSASTIMGYAGICAPNVQLNSDDHFHGVSLLEIGNFISASGGTCAATTNISNNAPTITSTNGGFIVPISTPFALTSTANDPNAGDVLWYRWEQMNNQVSTQPPVSTSTNGPNFRSFSSSTNPTRYFPNLQAIANNGPFTWEVLPSVARTMNFRCTVHDDHEVGGCSDYINTTVTFDATAGPFVLTNPTATGITWQATTSQTVTWNVANTTNANVNCQMVDIYLSTNGGTSYPVLLAANVPNSGSALVTVPNLPNTTSRVMVIADNGTFFDVSNNNFTITIAPNTYQLVAANTIENVCAGTNADFTMNILQLGSYTDPVSLSFAGLPSGATASWSVNPVATPSTSTLSINTSAVAQGNYSFTVNAASNSGAQSVNLTLNVTANTPSPVALIAPISNAIGISSPVNFSWNPSATPNVTYTIQIATDIAFGSVVETQSGLLASSYSSNILSSGTLYFWRVSAENICGSSAFSLVEQFTTSNCTLFASTNVPVNISASGTPTITSTLNVPQSGIISNVDVLNLVGIHTYISDLLVSLTSPNGTTVQLFDGICFNQDNFDLNFSENAPPGAIPCPPTTGLTYQPSGNLADFIGEEMQGVWTLTIQDLFNLDGGSLQSWSLDICYDLPVCPIPSIAPVSINALGTPYCIGGELGLTQIGGSLAPGAVYEWFTSACNGTPIGTGNTIAASPLSNTDFFVRASAGVDCPATACAIFNLTIPSASNSLSIDGDFATCQVNAGNWVHFYNNNGRLIASVNSNGQNLGNVTATSFVNGTPHIVPSCTDPTEPAFFNAALARSFVITPQFQLTTPVSVRLYILNNEFSDYQSTSISTAANPFDDVTSLAQMNLTKHAGTSQDGSPMNNCVGGTTLFIPQSTSGTTNTLFPAVTNSSYLEYVISGFSEFFPMNSDNSALPVTLTYFAANCEDHSILISWSTATETNASHFRLESSRDGLTWLLLSEIQAAGTTSQFSNYSYSDIKFANTTIYYRLTQVDFDGTEVIYPATQITCDTDQNAMVIYPNPTKSDFNLALTVAENYGKQTIVVTDLAGKIVASEVITMDAGAYLIPFKNINWSQGAYLIFVEGLNQYFKPQKLVVQ